MPPAQALASGTLLQGGAYRITSVIGAGGFGIVYKAVNRRGKAVAVKELFPRGTTRRRYFGLWRSRRVRPGSNWDQLQQQMRDEFRLVKPLRHPHIVRAIELFGANGTLYLVMEYIDGDTLQARLDRHPTGLPAGEVRRLATALGSALEFAHSRDVIHRDIKPANVLLRRSGEPVLADFGLAGLLSDATRARSGTRTLMAPEQFAGRVQGPPADIYALGATLYNALTGHPPPPAEERLRHDTLEIAQPVSELTRAVHNALELDLGRRTPTAAEFLRDVRGGLKSPERVARRTRRRWRRRLLLAIGLGLALLIWAGCPRGPSPGGVRGVTPISR